MGRTGAIEARRMRFGGHVLPADRLQRLQECAGLPAGRDPCRRA
jgi:hypothetical protein